MSSSLSNLTAPLHQEIYPYQKGLEAGVLLNLNDKNFAQKLIDQYKKDYNDRNSERKVFREKEYQTDFTLMKPTLLSFNAFLEDEPEILGSTIERFILANVLKAHNIEIKHMDKYRVTELYKNFESFFPNGKWAWLLREDPDQEKLIESMKEKYHNVLRYKNILVHILQSILQGESENQTSYLFHQLYFEDLKIKVKLKLNFFQKRI